MATVPRAAVDDDRDVDYPTTDGKPMGETELHRDQMIDLIETLKDHFAPDPGVYVTGNLLVFYERGDPRKHLSPDVFAVRGVPKQPRRDYYLIWREGKAPEVVIEVTSKTTRREDQTKKWVLYRDVMRVAEYFLFDPTEDYLKPPFQGFRLVDGDYVPIQPVDGRLPSEVLGLHLERVGEELRFFDPKTGQWLPTPRERLVAERQRAKMESQRAEAERQRAEAERQRAEAERQRAEKASRRAETEKAERERMAAEIERLQRELDALKKQGGGKG